MPNERLNRFLSRSGLCSRRQADRWIKAGRVTVNGQAAFVGLSVDSEDRVEVDGQPIKGKPESVYLLYHKPVGVVCTHDLSVKNNLVEAVGFSQRLVAAGRLDKDSEGLMLLTNDGELVNRILQPDHGHEKAYRVTVNRSVSEAFLKRMAAGVSILDTVTRPCEVTRLDEYCFEIVLTQGINRQIRRMCKALGYRVERLQRVRVMHLELQELAEGSWRPLSRQERQTLLASVG